MQRGWIYAGNDAVAKATKLRSADELSVARRSRFSIAMTKPFEVRHDFVTETGPTAKPCHALSLMTSILPAASTASTIGMSPVVFMFEHLNNGQKRS